MSMLTFVKFAHLANVYVYYLIDINIPWNLYGIKNKGSIWRCSFIAWNWLLGFH